MVGGECVLDGLRSRGDGGDEGGDPGDGGGDGDGGGWVVRVVNFEVKPLRSLAPVTKSRLWTTKTRGFPCACHEK